MRRILLSRICCPRCFAPSAVLPSEERNGQIQEGLLRCTRSQHLYPIIRSIPRLLSTPPEDKRGIEAHVQNLIICTGRKPGLDDLNGKQGRTRKSFGREWTTYQIQRPEEDEAYFRSKTGTDPAILRGKWVLDAGCGSGRYALVAGKAGAEVVAVNFSQAVETAAAGTAHLSNVHILQADIFNLPLFPSSFDFIYSLGVLHHTPNTKKALDRLIPLLNAEGEIALWLYPRWPLPVEIYNRLLRGVTTRLSLERVHRLAVLMEPVGLWKLRLLSNSRWWKKLLGQILRGLTIGVSYHPDREIRICDTFDWFSPPYQWHHTDTEVESWLRGYGLVAIRNLSVGQKHYQFHYGHGINFKARRSADDLN